MEMFDANVPIQLAIGLEENSIVVSAWPTLDCYSLARICDYEQLQTWKLQSQSSKLRVQKKRLWLYA